MPTMRVPCPLGSRKAAKAEDVSVLVDLEAGALEGGLEALELRGKDAVLELHGCGGVLHGAVVDDDELLNVFGDRRLGVARELSGGGEVWAP